MQRKEKPKDSSSSAEAAESPSSTSSSKPPSEETSPLGNRAYRAGRRLALKPKKGWAMNPLLQFPRNKPCPCRSGKKFKLCHLGLLPQVVPESVAKQFKEQMSKPDLVFITAENKDSIEAEARAILADNEASKLDNGFVQ